MRLGGVTSAERWGGRALREDMLWGCGGFTDLRWRFHRFLVSQIFAPKMADFRTENGGFTGFRRRRQRDASAERWGGRALLVGPRCLAETRHVRPPRVG